MAELTLTIKFTPASDEFRVNGPIENMVLCYGMLERARDVIKDVHDGKLKGTKSKKQKGESVLVSPHGGKLDS